MINELGGSSAGPQVRFEATTDTGLWLPNGQFSLGPGQTLDSLPLIPGLAITTIFSNENGTLVQVDFQ